MRSMTGFQRSRSWLLRLAQAASGFALREHLSFYEDKGSVRVCRTGNKKRDKILFRCMLFKIVRVVLLPLFLFENTSITDCKGKQKKVFSQKEGIAFAFFLFR